MIPNYRELYFKISKKYSGVWVTNPIYLLGRKNSYSKEFDCLYREGKKGELYAYFPIFSDNLPDLLKNFNSLHGISKEQLDFIKSLHGDLFTSRISDYDYIYDRSLLRTLAGSKIKNIRTQVNAFYRNNCKIVLFDRTFIEPCNKVFDKWKDKWKERHTGFMDMVTSASYTRAGFTYFYDLPGSFFLVALNSRDEVIGFNLMWYSDTRCLSIARGHDYEHVGVEPALMNYAAKNLPDSIIEWNDGCSDGKNGTLTKHKMLYRPIEVRPSYSIDSKIFTQREGFPGLF